MSEINQVRERIFTRENYCGEKNGREMLGHTGEGVVTALLLARVSDPVLSQFLPLRALVIITALPILLRCVHP